MDRCSNLEFKVQQAGELHTPTVSQVLHSSIKMEDRWALLKLIRLFKVDRAHPEALVQAPKSQQVGCSQQVAVAQVVLRLLESLLHHNLLPRQSKI